MKKGEEEEKEEQQTFENIQREPASNEQAVDEKIESLREKMRESAGIAKMETPVRVCAPAALNTDITATNEWGPSEDDRLSMRLLLFSTDGGDINTTALSARGKPCNEELKSCDMLFTPRNSHHRGGVEEGKTEVDARNENIIASDGIDLLEETRATTSSEKEEEKEDEEKEEEEEEEGKKEDMTERERDSDIDDAPLSPERSEVAGPAAETETDVDTESVSLYSRCDSPSDVGIHPDSCYDSCAGSREGQRDTRMHHPLAPSEGQAFTHPPTNWQDVQEENIGLFGRHIGLSDIELHQDTASNISAEGGSQISGMESWGWGGRGEERGQQVQGNSEREKEESWQEGSDRNDGTNEEGEREEEKVEEREALEAEMQDIKMCLAFELGSNVWCVVHTIPR